MNLFSKRELVKTDEEDAGQESRVGVWELVLTGVVAVDLLNWVIVR